MLQTSVSATNQRNGSLSVSHLLIRPPAPTTLPIPFHKLSSPSPRRRPPSSPLAHVPLPIAFRFLAPALPALHPFPLQTMSYRPSPSPHPAVVLDTTPPRPQPSGHSETSEVIVLDSSPRSNPPILPNASTSTATNSSPIIVEEHPPKRRRRDNPASLPVHPRATSPSHAAPSVIIVDDEDTSDPDTPPALTNPSLLLSAAPAPVAPPRTHVRLPRINTARNLRLQDDVIEMSATGPTVNRTPLSAQPPSNQHTRLPIPPTRNRYTSMPPLFSFDQSTTTAPPDLSAPTPPTGRRCPRATNPSTRHSHPLPRLNNTQSTTNPATSIFPLPLPEQALPSTGRRAPRVNRHVTFADTIQQDVVSHSVSPALSVVRDLENGIGRAGRTSSRIRTDTHTPGADSYIQVLNGPAVFFGSEPPSAQNRAPSNVPNSHIGQEAHRQSSFSHANVVHRPRGTFATPLRTSRSAQPELSRAGVHRTHGVPGQRMSRAYAQQLNAMHAASNGMPLQEDGASFVAQNPASRASPASGSFSSGPMIVRATLRSTSSAPRSVSSTVGTAMAVAEAAQATAARFPAGLGLSTNQDRLSYGSRPGFSISTLRNGPGRRSNQQRHTNQPAARRRHHTSRALHHLRIYGSVTTGIEIQYLHGIPGDGPLDYEQLIRLDEHLIRDKNRADQSQIDSLPVRSATAEDKDIRCCICMCDVEEGEELRVLPCSHKYHKDCIDRTLLLN